MILHHSCTLQMPLPLLLLLLLLLLLFLASPLSGCEREPVLASVAQQLLGHNGLQQQVAVVRKLSSQLTVGFGAPASSKGSGAASPSAATGSKTKATAGGTAAGGKGAKTAAAGGTAGAAGGAKTAAAAGGGGPAPDLPAAASLVVHEIFGTDPLSERVLPTMAQVQVRGQHCKVKEAWLFMWVAGWLGQHGS
jgi:hypothetical protein